MQATLSDIIRQLGMTCIHLISCYVNCMFLFGISESWYPSIGSHFGVDLMHKKAEVKAIVTDVINNMSDDEGEAGDDEDEDLD